MYLSLCLSVKWRCAVHASKLPRGNTVCTSTLCGIRQELFFVWRVHLQVGANSSVKKNEKLKEENGRFRV